MYGSLQLSRTDAVAMAILRGRDFGLASYNQIREALNIPPVRTWEEINFNLSMAHPEVCTVAYTTILAIIHSYIKCSVSWKYPSCCPLTVHFQYLVFNIFVDICGAGQALWKWYQQVGVVLRSSAGDKRGTRSSVYFHCPGPVWTH